MGPDGHDAAARARLITVVIQEEYRLGKGLTLNT
jgi:hypothetical protein